MTSDQLVEKTSTSQHDTQKIHTSMLPAAFEPATPAGQRTQTHTVDRAATVTGTPSITPTKWTVLTNVCTYVCIYVCTCVCRFQNVVLRCPTARLHCFLSSHWPSFRFLSFMAFLIPSIQFFFGLPRALFCFGTHFSVILGNLPSAILWTWPYL